MVCCGEHGPAAVAIAMQWNARWEEWQKANKSGDATQEPAKLDRIYPPGTLGEAFARYRATNAWFGKKPRTREDWERGWKLFEGIFGRASPRAASLEDLDEWYATLLKSVGVREAHRAMKIWRALWRVVATLRAPDGEKYCVRAEDPSLGIRRKTPAPRNATWSEGEVVRLVKHAWRENFRGLATLLWVAWDTMLSPVDVRRLTRAQLSHDAQGPLFSLARAKTGKAAIGTLGKRAARMLAEYVATLPAGLHPSSPIFYTRGHEPGPSGGKPRPPVPYTKDTLGDDFRVIRNEVFPGDRRQLMDFRRSGAVEATAGGVDPAALAGKMANSIDQNKELQATYLPHNATLVRLADAARARGRSRMRGAPSGSKGPSGQGQ